MIKKILLFIFVNVNSILFSQEEIISFKNSLKTTSSNLKDVIPVVNTANGEIAFFVADAKNVYGYKINSDFEIVNKISSEEKSRKFKILIGSSVSDDDSFNVFLTNKKKNQFAAVKFSFSDGTTSMKEFSIGANETFIQTVSSDNQFYLISGSKLNNKLYIYSFKNQVKKNIIDISNLRFINTQGRAEKLLNLLVKNNDLNKFDENDPHSIELTSEQRKMYIKSHTIFITLDHHKMYTQVLEIDLNTFLANSFQFNKPKLGEKSKRTNSYLNGNNVFTLATTKDEFTVEILDFKTGNLLKKYSAKKDEDIAFKNTGIIQRGGLYDSNRDLIKTKRFLKRIAQGNTGLSVRKLGNKYYLTIGGYIVQKRGGMMMPIGSFPIASMGSATVFFNPTQIAFNSFTNNKTTTIVCLLDENFNHISGDIEDNVFDKMKNYTSGNKGSTVFKYKGFYVKTEYNSFSKDFVFRKFTD